MHVHCRKQFQSGDAGVDDALAAAQVIHRSKWPKTKEESDGAAWRVATRRAARRDRKKVIKPDEAAQGSSLSGYILPNETDQLFMLS